MSASVVETEPMRTLHEFSGQKILVTGASGFIGSNLCRCLCKNGAQVHAVSRTLRTTDTSCLRWWQGNLEDIASVRNLLYTVSRMRSFIWLAMWQEAVTWNLYCLRFTVI